LTNSKNSTWRSVSNSSLVFTSDFVPTRAVKVSHVPRQKPPSHFASLLTYCTVQYSTACGR
jgi:hypothetical protein